MSPHHKKSSSVRIPPIEHHQSPTLQRIQQEQLERKTAFRRNIILTLAAFVGTTVGVAPIIWLSLQSAPTLPPPSKPDATRAVKTAPMSPVTSLQEPTPAKVSPPPNPEVPDDILAEVDLPPPATATTAPAPPAKVEPITPPAAPGTVLLAEGFELPRVPQYAEKSIPAQGWIGSSVGYMAESRGIHPVSRNGGPVVEGRQAYALSYTNAGLTTIPGSIGSLTAGTTYVLSYYSWPAPSNQEPSASFVQLLACADSFQPENLANGNEAAATILVEDKRELPPGKAPEEVELRFTVPNNHPDLGKPLAVRLIQLGGRTTFYDQVILRVE